VLPITAYAALLAAEPLAPRVQHMLLHSSFAGPIHIAATIAGLGAIVALWTRRFQLARVAVGALAVLIIWGWLFAQYPFVIPPTMTVFDAASPPATLRAFVAAIAVGALVLIPSLWYLYGVFRRSHQPEPETPH